MYIFFLLEDSGLFQRVPILSEEEPRILILENLLW